MTKLDAPRVSIGRVIACIIPGVTLLLSLYSRFSVVAPWNYERNVHDDDQIYRAPTMSLDSFDVIAIGCCWLIVQYNSAKTSGKYAKSLYRGIGCARVSGAVRSRGANMQ